MGKEMFPPAFTDEGGVQTPYVPTEEEMENCAFARQVGAKCPRKDCGTCLYHPWKTAIKRMFFGTKEGRQN